MDPRMTLNSSPPSVIITGLYHQGQIVLQGTRMCISYVIKWGTSCCSFGISLIFAGEGVGSPLPAEASHGISNRNSSHRRLCNIAQWCSLFPSWFWHSHHQCEWWTELLFSLEAGLSLVDDADVVRWVSVGCRGGIPFFHWHLFDLEEEKGQGQDLSACTTWHGNLWMFDFD